jgi:uncharacterized protein YprB with RNaseH-like and TPR domain
MAEQEQPRSAGGGRAARGPGQTGKPRDARAARLINRLGYLQPPGRQRSGPSVRPGKALTSGGWERVGQFTYRRQVRRPQPPAAGGPRLSPYLVPRGLEADKLLVFDTETTGLSAGAGSFIFLMGTGWLEGDTACYEQIFATDFPGEPEFLNLVESRLNKAGLLVSYNGKGFDSHVLRTRFALNGRECRLGEQLDLLYWARRLWKRRLGDCSLGSIERNVLGVGRSHDIPGFEIPAVYLNYLRRGEEERLERVFEHNLQDLDSLFRLLFVINDILVSERSPVEADQAALGSYLVERMDSRGAARLEGAFNGGDIKAGRVLSIYYKRRGLWREAAAVWKRMAMETRSLFAVVELAKYHEHRRHDFEAALAWVEKALAWKLPLERSERQELARRKRRLRNKLEKGIRDGNN